jgi:hypothetical protein
MSGKGRQFLDDDLRPSAADGVLDGGGIQGISHHRFGSQGAQVPALRDPNASCRRPCGRRPPLRHERSPDSSVRAGNKHSHFSISSPVSPQPDPSRSLFVKSVIRAQTRE